MLMFRKMGAISDIYGLVIIVRGATIFLGVSAVIQSRLICAGKIR